MAEMTVGDLLKLTNRFVYESLEKAMVLAKRRGNSHIDASHLIHQMANIEGGDLELILNFFNVRSVKFSLAIEQEINMLPSANSKVESIHDDVLFSIEHSKAIAGPDYALSPIRTGHIFLTLISEIPKWRNFLANRFPQINRERLFREFQIITKHSVEFVNQISRGSVFISYRRGIDEGSAGRVFERIEAEFGRGSAFFDSDSIPLGQDYREFIRKSIANASIFMPIIGNGWIEAIPRLNDIDDVLRFEIRTAISEANTQIIPVYFGDLNAPSPDTLPEDLRPLTRVNGIKITHS
ncbi:MAG: TIR domain-containing protein, partial [Pseudomonadota bacterium]